ncbi:endo alpha-1,4 polygalactosaminidase [Chloroflexus islandicus]|uniref:Endo alpha-1,4 polygalactosaminidase n=2 Tax=Chloroflexus islandicus TaxID=1707952 RepID=A0A178MGC1_9CHLR|nr:endo alpha-1,4 polygalactosaminidase [Chloroflexus islandicus]
MVARVYLRILLLLLVAGCAPLPATAPTSMPSSRLPLQARWQIQYTGPLQIDIDVDVFNVDLFDAPAETIALLRRRGVFVMCYFSAGSYEDWRPDATRFPAAVLGKELAGWPGERWLDIRQLDALAPIMQTRLDLAVSKGCDGVDPDNVNGYANDTGFPLTAADQERYNIWLAEAAHQRGLLIGLKNDLAQIPALVASFDWVLNEECFSYQECDLLLPFLQAGKPVFVIEYELAPAVFCPQAQALNLNALHKHWQLDAYRVDCREWRAHP